MSARSHWLAPCLVCWFCAGSNGLFRPGSGWAADAKTIDERFHQVERMSDQERSRLQRNIDEFKKLTPEQQAHYRDLHDKVEKSTSHLSSLMQEYSAWLTTLTPGQRDELGRATDTATKLALIRQFKEAQEYRPEATSPEIAEAPVIDLPMVREQLMRMGPPLKGSELATVMNVLSKDLHGVEKKKPESESALTFYRELLKGSIEKSPEGPRNWPSADLQRDLEQIPAVKEHLKKRPDGGRVALIRLIVGSLWSLAIEEIKPTYPSEQERQEVFNGLDPKMQTEINRLRRDEARRHLDRLYYKQRGDESPLKIRDFQQFVFQMMGQLGLPQGQPSPLGGDGFRGGPGPGGPRRPPDGRPFGPEGGRPGEPPRGRNDPERPRPRPNE